MNENKETCVEISTKCFVRLHLILLKTINASVSKKIVGYKLVWKLFPLAGQRMYKYANIQGLKTHIEDRKAYSDPTYLKIVEYFARVISNVYVKLFW